MKNSNINEVCYTIHPDNSSNIDLCRVCLILLPKVSVGNTSQYLSQMRYDIHKTFSIFADWSPDLINNVCLHTCARKHTQQVKTFGTPQFIRQMYSDFDQTWYNAIKKIGSNTCMHAQPTCVNVHTPLYNQ